MALKVALAVATVLCLSIAAISGECLLVYFDFEVYV